MLDLTRTTRIVDQRHHPLVEPAVRKVFQHRSKIFGPVTDRHDHTDTPAGALQTRRSHDHTTHGPTPCRQVSSDAQTITEAVTTGIHLGIIHLAR